MTAAALPASSPDRPWTRRAWVAFASGLEVFNIAVVYAIFVPYFVSNMFETPERGQVVWGEVAALGGLIAAIVAPFLGFLAERPRMRRLLLAAGLALNAIPAFTLGYAEPGLAGPLLALVLVALAVTTMANDINYMLLGAALPDVAPGRKMARTSAAAVSVGWAVGITVTVAFTLLFVRSDMLGLGLDPERFEAERLAGPIAGALMLVLCLPLVFAPFPERRASTGPRLPWFAQLKQTLQALLAERAVAIAIGARFFYWSGLVLVQLFGAALGRSVFDWNTETTAIFGLSVLVFGAVGAALGGFLEDRVGSRNAMIIVVLGLAVTMLALLTMQPDRIFLVFDVAPRGEGDAMLSSVAERVALSLGALSGLFIGPMGPITRTLIARLSPPGREARYFGLSTLAGNSTNAFGPFLVAQATLFFDNQRMGMLVSPILLLIGAAILTQLPSARTSRTPAA